MSSSVVNGEVRFTAEPILAMIDLPVPDGVLTVTLDQLPSTTLEAVFAAMDAEVNVPPVAYSPASEDRAATGVSARLARFLPQIAIVCVVPLPAE